MKTIEELEKDYNTLIGLGLDDWDIVRTAESFSTKEIEIENPLSILFLKESDNVNKLKLATVICTTLLHQNKPK